MSDIAGFDGADLTSADFGTVAYGVLLNSDKTVMELFSFDPSTIASSSISFVYRGLKFDGDLTTEVAANKLDWTSGSTILIGTDTPQVLQWLKAYIDGIAIAGSPDMTTTTKGIAEEATQAEVDAGTATGGTSARLAVNPSTIRAKQFHDYAADSVGTDSYAITVSPAITAYAAGQRFIFKAGAANTGAATLNVCGLGAKDIKKDVSTALATGDILLNQVVEVVYDGTNMQMVSQLSGTVANQALPVTKTYLTGDSPATWTKPTGLKYVVVQVQAGGGGGGRVNTDGAAGGGGAGGYSKKTIAAATLGATETVTIGAGGLKADAGGTAAGTAGGNSSFGAHATATGGTNCDGFDVAGGAGGAAASGDLNITGESGMSGIDSVDYGGDGGNSILGFGGKGGRGAAGGAATLYGAGGGGGGKSSSTTGGNGSAGIVIVTEYF